MIMQNRYDVIIIGGGPAGITASLYAARGKCSVCLIDRKETPGFPVRCGEAIGLKGFTSCVSLKPEWIKSSIGATKLVSPSGISVSLPNDYEGYIIDREKMEYDMVQDAVNSGVTFIPKTTIASVTKTADGLYECTSADGMSVFHAPCVMLAEGVESRLARSLGWKTQTKLSDIISCAFARIVHPDIDSTACSFYMGKDIAPGGYVWVFPRGENTANVGLDVLGSVCTSAQPKVLLEQFIQKNFPGATISDMHGGGVPMAPWITPLVKDGVMIIGDAARMVNCTTGAGIAYALYSGKTAGTIAAQAFTNKTCDYRHLKGYEKAWASHYGKQQRRSYALKNTMVTFSDAFLDDVAVSLAKTDMQNMSVLKIFIKAFSKHPLQLLKVIRLFR